MSIPGRGRIDPETLTLSLAAGYVSPLSMSRRRDVTRRRLLLIVGGAILARANSLKIDANDLGSATRFRVTCAALGLLE